MRRCTEKEMKKGGFTVIELVVVVAVMAVLSSVAIPAFSGIIDKAHLSSDIQLARTGNTILEVSEIYAEVPTTAEEVMTMLEEGGIPSCDLAAGDHALYWVPAENELVICDLEADLAVFPEEYKGKLIHEEWVILEGETQSAEGAGDYTDHARLSQLSGKIVEQEGYITTDLIDLSAYAYPMTIRTQGVDFRTSEYSHCCYGVYRSSDEFVKCRSLDDSIQTSDEDEYEFSFDSEGNLTLIHKSGGRYIRLCGYGSGADLVVTIQQHSGSDPGDDGSAEGDGEEGGTDGESTAPEYTNWLNIAIDSQGNIYNGCGYKEGYYISTNTQQERQRNGFTVTGYIPLCAGQTIRVKNFDLTGNYALYDSSFQPIQANPCSAIFRQEGENGVNSWTSDSEEAHYIRLSGKPGEDPVITVDEEI